MLNTLPNVSRVLNSKCPKLKSEQGLLKLRVVLFYELKQHTCRDSPFGNYELMFKVTNEEPQGMYLNHGQSWDSTSRTRL